MKQSTTEDAYAECILSGVEFLWRRRYSICSGRRVIQISAMRNGIELGRMTLRRVMTYYSPDMSDLPIDVVSAALQHAIKLRNRRTRRR